jgi:hypothetical protein
MGRDRTGFYKRERRKRRRRHSTAKNAEISRRARKGNPILPRMGTGLRPDFIEGNKENEGGIRRCPNLGVKCYLIE